MVIKFSPPSKHLYDVDYLQWIEETLEKLRHQDYAAVDWANLLEEIEDMGRSERRGLESNLIILLTHLLEWQYQPEYQSGSWQGTILEHRRRINKALKESPSLEPYLEEIWSGSYRDAVEQASAETGLSIAVFPAECPYNSRQSLERGFLPE